MSLMHEASLAVLSNYQSDFVLVTWPPGRRFTFIF